MTDFIIIGNKNAITCKEVFPLIKEGKMGLGYKKMSGGMDFYNDTPICKRPKYDENGNAIVNVESIWYSTFPVKKRPLVLTKSYSPDKYPKYDNYDAINIDRIKDIPYDYDGVMGVPITFLDRYCPSQFEIVWTTDRGGDGKLEDLKNKSWKGLWDSAFVNGQKVYKRIFIKKVCA